MSYGLFINKMSLYSFAIFRENIIEPLFIPIILISLEHLDVFIVNIIVTIVHVEIIMVHFIKYTYV